MMTTLMQGRVERWVTKCFGMVVLLDKRERVRRLVEEAIELAQAAGLTIQDVADIGNYVYARPAGEVAQEIGGCGVTLLGLGAAFDVDVIGATMTEIDRIESLDPEHFRKRHAAKHAAGICSDAGGAA